MLLSLAKHWIGAQAIAEMVRQLRDNKGKTGLIMGNGGLATYEVVICLSRSPRRDGLSYPIQKPLPEQITDVQIPPTVEKAEGDAIIEVQQTSIPAPLMMPFC